MSVAAYFELNESEAKQIAAQVGAAVATGARARRSWGSRALKSIAWRLPSSMTIWTKRVPWQQPERPDL